MKYKIKMFVLCRMENVKSKIKMTMRVEKRVGKLSGCLRSGATDILLVEGINGSMGTDYQLLHPTAAAGL